MNIPINENAPVKAQNQIEIVAPAFTVWTILSDIKNWSLWQKAVTNTIVHGDIKEGTQFDWKASGLSFKSRIHTAIAYSEIGWTGTTIGTSAVHNWTLEENEGKTIVKVEESLNGILPKLFKRNFQKNLEKGILTNLKELKTASEEK